MPLSATGRVQFPAVTLTSGIGFNVGGSLMALTVRVKAELAVDTPSLTVNVITADPVWFGAGVIATLRLLPLPLITMLVTGTSVGTDEVAVTLRLEGFVSGSATTKLTLATVSSLIV